MTEPRATRPADNPFASRRIDHLEYRFLHSSMDEALAALARDNRRGAVVGPHGSGKTTFLETLATRLTAEVVWIRLNSETKSPGPAARTGLPEKVGQHHAILVDGAEQLGAWAWRGFHLQTRSAGTLVITTHHPGRLPTVHSCSTVPHLLRELVQELAPDAAESLNLNAIFHRHRGNLRLCFRELYDLWAGRSRFAYGNGIYSGGLSADI